MDPLENKFIERQNKPGTTIEWETLEYEHLERHSDWFWLVGLAGFAVFLLAVVTLNFLFAIVIIIATFSVMMYGARKPELIKIILSRRGIQFGDIFYPYKNISAFAIRDDQEPYKLIIHINRIFLPHVSVYFEMINPDQVRKYLAEFLTEEPYDEPFLEIISERLGF